MYGIRNDDNEYLMRGFDCILSLSLAWYAVQLEKGFSRFRFRLMTIMAMQLAFSFIIHSRLVCKQNN